MTRKRTFHMTLQSLLLALIALVFLCVLLVEQVFLRYYEETLRHNARMVTNASADQLFSDISTMWYELNLVSGTLSRSDAMRAFVQEESPDEQTVQALRSAIRLTQLASDLIESIIVTDFDGLTLFAYGERDERVLEAADRAMRNGLVVKNPVHMQLGEGAEAVTYCINCTDQAAGGTVLYTLLVYDIDKVRQSIERIGRDYGTDLLLLDGNYVPLLFTEEMDAAQRTAYVDLARSSDGRSFQDALQVRSLALMRWRLVASARESVLAERMRTMGTFCTVLNSSMLLVLVLFFLVLRRHIHQPVHQMLQFMRRQAEHPTMEHLDLHIKNELNSIAEGLNDMLRRQRRQARENLENRENLYRVQLAQKQLEITALTHQINPHFLYNTFDCMRGMAMAGGNAGLEEIISAMAQIFRYATKADAYVPIADEIRSIEHYMRIVSVRHAGRIGASYAVEASAMGAHIPKMVLQPIVENAVLHGLETVARGGMLSIRAWNEGGRLHVTVEDDGKGMPPEAVLTLRALLLTQSESGDIEGGHIGLVNIHRRLRLLYGDAGGVSVESAPGRGTRVMIWLPADISPEREESA